MKSDDAVQLFDSALNVFGGSSNLLNFYNKIWTSNLPFEEKNFWLCICNDFEDVKFDFRKNLDNFIKKNPNPDRKSWKYFLKGE